MKITTKGFYAVEIMRALAAWENSLPMSLADVEAKTGVPRSYVARILLRMKKQGLAESFRGNAGGYRLSQKPSKITLAKVFGAAGEDIAPWPEAPRVSQKQRDPSKKRRPIICPIDPVWRKLYDHNLAFFEHTTLADFM